MSGEEGVRGREGAQCPTSVEATSAVRVRLIKAATETEHDGQTTHVALTGQLRKIEKRNCAMRTLTSEGASERPSTLLGFQR